MKAIHLPYFISFAANFSIESIVKAICGLSFEANKESVNGVDFLGKRYSYYYCRNSYSVMVVQTWLLDLLYDLIKYDSIFGDNTISRDETLHLISLYNDYSDKMPECDSEDYSLYLFGFFGEQMKIELRKDFIDNFARESYILEFVSKRDTQYNIDISKIFEEETGYSENTFSAMLILIWFYCNEKNYVLDYKTMCLDESFPFSKDDLFKIIEKYSATFDEIKNSSIKRQFLYSKPFIKIGSSYISVNPYLTLCLFTNSNYWIIRNYYKGLNEKSEHFIRAFGKYFELYVEEIFSNCLSPNEFVRIPEGSHMRADWKLSICGRDFLIEQKSTISAIGIKQNNPDVEALKKYIRNTWYKAAKQLNETEKDLNLNQPIKIILLYEDYYKSESLEELYSLQPDLKDDKRLWLMTIKELEMFMMLYSESPEKAQRVFFEKNDAELTNDKYGRDWMRFLAKEDVKHNDYLKKFGIYNQFNKILDLLSKG